jgi:hypothetical protein
MHPPSLPQLGAVLARDATGGRKPQAEVSQREMLTHIDELPSTRRVCSVLYSTRPNGRDGVAVV